MSYHGGMGYYYSGMGQLDIEPAVKIDGHPVIALIAQLNRFAGKKVSPGSGCGDRNYLPGGPLPLTVVLDEKAATIAVLILADRYDCVRPDLKNIPKAAQVNAALSNSIDFVLNNLTEVVTTIAQFGDSLGLAPAVVGITKVDPKMAPRSSMRTLLLVGALAIGAFMMMSKRSR